jgi:hypothetical protein
VRIVPKNWREFQHYKDRNPPWIRLHRKLLDDKDFQRLPVASRALAPMLWLLASESVDGAINGEVDDLAFRLRTTEKEIGAALKPLIEKGFFVLVQGASTALADGLRDAVPETETETETEALQRQKAPTVLVDRDAANPPYKVPDCPYESIVSAYHEELPVLQRMTVLNDSRREHIRARWREVCAADRFDAQAGADWFRWYFQRIAKSHFLTGKSPPRPGKGTFRANFDWLMLPTNFAKVVDGNYDNRAAA